MRYFGVEACAARIRRLSARAGRKLFVLLAFLCAAGPAQSSPPFPVAGKFSHAVQTISGVNWLSRHGLNGALALALRAKFGGNPKVRISTYNFSDLLAGKIKGVDISLDGSRFKGVSVASIRLQSTNPIWLRYFRKDGQRAGLRLPALFLIEGSVSEDNVASGLASQSVSSSLRSLKLDLPGLGGQRLQFLNPAVALQKDKVKIKSTLAVAGGEPGEGVSIELAGKPELAGNSKIVLENLQVDSPDIPNPKEFAQFTSSLVNPLIDFGRLDRATHAFRMNHLELLDCQVKFDGNLLLAPRPTANMIAKKAGK